MPPTRPALARHERYANERHSADLTIAAVDSAAIWACLGPLAADQHSWTLLVWEAQDHGLVADRAVRDAGAAARAGCRRALPNCLIQRDQWQVLHRCGQFQGRLKRCLRDRHKRTATLARQATRLAAGQRPKGRNPQTDLAGLLCGWPRSSRSSRGWAT
jgi:hypothetical protein